MSEWYDKRQAEKTEHPEGQDKSVSGNGKDAELEDAGRTNGAYFFSDSSSSSMSKVGLFLLLLKIQPES